MARIKWIEELADNEPHAELDLRFCNEGKKYMKYIMTFILWIDTTVNGNIYYRIIHESSEFKIHCSFKSDEATIKRIHNRFRTLVRKYYRKEE